MTKNIVRFGCLINESNFNRAQYGLLIRHARNAVNNSEHSWVYDGPFLKAVEVILRSSITSDSKCISISNLRSCLIENKDLANNPQNKLNIVLYAMLINHGVIHTYLIGEIRYEPCIKRPNNKESYMSSYLLDNQVTIREDISWLKSKDQKKFKELCSDIDKMQDKEIKEIFENYLNQINYEEKRNALKYTAGTLAAICVVTGIIAIAGKSAVIGVITAIAGVMLSICVLYNNKLEYVNVMHKSKECASHNSNFFAGSRLLSVIIENFTSFYAMS